MSLSTGRLKDDSVLVKNHEAIQKAGLVTDVCVSKTGILTAGTPHVQRYHIADFSEAYVNERAHTFGAPADCEEGVQALYDTISESILMNSEVFMQAEDPKDTHYSVKDTDLEFRYVPKGPAVEIGMINMLSGTKSDADVREMLNSLRATKLRLFQLPFDQKFKRKLVVYKLNEEEARVVVKGAPEQLVELCSNRMSENGEEIEFGDEDKDTVLNLIIKDGMATSGLKPLTYATKKVLLSDVDEIKKRMQKGIDLDDSEDIRQQLEADLIYLGTFGLKDEISHDQVVRPIKLLRYGKEDVATASYQREYVKVRMFTGDHPATAFAVAQETGIISEADLEGKDQDQVAMLASDICDQFKEFCRIEDDEIVCDEEQYD